MDRERLIEMICEELDEAYDLHGNEKWGRHEFFGIITEEFEEMKAEIFKGGHTPFDKDRLQKEIIQVAAMCMRYLETGDR